MKQLNYGPSFVVILAAISTTVLGMKLPENETTASPELTNSNLPTDTHTHATAILELTDVEEVGLDSAEVYSGECNTTKILRGVLKLKEHSRSELSTNENRGFLQVLATKPPLATDLRKTLLVLELQNAILNKLTATRSPNLGLFNKFNKNKFNTLPMLPL